MRLIVVANRLPVTAQECESRLTFQESAGGLVSGLQAYLENLKTRNDRAWDHLWVGWPGLAMEEEQKRSFTKHKILSFFKVLFKKSPGERKKEELRSKIYAEYRSYPVFLTGRDLEKFYDGFCNNTLWPLFHYFPSYAAYDHDCWKYYKKVNEMYRDAVLAVAKPGDLLWIHDYQLMLLPKLLRDKAPDLTMGFFLHIPFPAFEIFRMLPKAWREELLQGMLGADLIGFHTHEYTQYFLQTALRILGVEHNLGEMVYAGRFVKADTFPMGIDFDKFNSAVDEKKVKLEKKKWRETLKDYRIIFSVDRLDYTKGILNRLKGYEAFLEKHDEWQNRVVFLMVVVPSRTAVEQYQRMKREIDELVGRINGRFGNIRWTPLIYQYRSIYFEYLTALYSISDVALITPLRDGMNLVAKEYIAAKRGDDGVLILSEMAGASKELGEAIIINPNHIEEIAQALKQALEMPREEMKRRNQAMQDRLRRYDIIKWADDFLDTLSSVKAEQVKFQAKLLGRSAASRLAGDFGNAGKRLLLLDYDGTLVPFADKPQGAAPPENLVRLLRELSVQEKNDLVILSGRDRHTLSSWFSTLNAGFAAEHGAWIREKGEDWRMLKPLTNSWKARVHSILVRYTDRLPGSFIEEKEFAVVWHYRKSDPEMASLRKAELLDELVQLTAGMDLQAAQGNKVIEVRNAGINKGIAGLHWVSRGAYDFIMAVGDDWTDEDLFMALPPIAFTIRVGYASSHAAFNVRDHTEVLKLLSKLNEKSERP